MELDIQKKKKVLKEIAGKAEKQGDRTLSLNWLYQAAVGIMPSGDFEAPWSKRNY